MGLGCENNQLDDLLAIAGDVDQSRLRFFSAQEVEDEIEAGEQAVAELAAVMASDRREPRPLHDLTIGVKCGGSTASAADRQPPRRCALGRGHPPRRDRLQTEIPEMFGAERGLMNRPPTSATFERVVQLIEAFKRYFTEHDQPVYENPSPGNKEGGLTTLEEKSLGAVQKGGRSLVTGVAITAEGPGPGPRASSTRRATTASPAPPWSSPALGSCSSPRAGHAAGLPRPHRQDLEQQRPREPQAQVDRLRRGPLLAPRAPTATTLARELLDHVIAVASGSEAARNESNGYREIAIWKRGVTL